MVLSDTTIKRELKQGNLVIRPLDAQDIQPASVDLRLDAQVRVFNTNSRSLIDVRENMDDLTETKTIEEGTAFIIHPGQFILGSTVEWVEIPEHLVGRLEGKSSLGRIGLVIHATAGFADPGFKGNLTLELSNNSPLPITLYEGMKIGQLCLLALTEPPERLYGDPSLGSKYQRQTGPTGSRFEKEFNQR